MAEILVQAVMSFNIWASIRMFILYLSVSVCMFALAYNNNDYEAEDDDDDGGQ